MCCYYLSYMGQATCSSPSNRSGSPYAAEECLGPIAMCRWFEQSMCFYLQSLQQLRIMLFIFNKRRYVPMYVIYVVTNL